MINLFPSDHVKSIFGIDFRALYAQGYRALLFDIDNTIVPHDAPADERAVKFFAYLKKCGFKTMAISNNNDERVWPFIDAVDADGYICKAHKPSPNGFLAAMETLGVTRDETIFVGDQIFTDIWGANNAGIRCILVDPVLKWHERPTIVIKRIFEMYVIAAYHIKRRIDENRNRK